MELLRSGSLEADEDCAFLGMAEKTFVKNDIN